jgi:hypothetical protein
MAITITHRPALFAPAQSAMYFRTTSTNSAQCSFRYVFDIYTGLTSYVSRYRLQARPDSSCVFTPNTVLKSFLGYETQPTIAAVTNSATAGMQYKIEFGEEYGLGGNCQTGTTIFSALTSFTGYAWNAVTQYEDFPSFDYTQFVMSANTPGRGRFLTSKPNNGFVENDDYETISFLNVNNNAPVAGFLYTLYDNAGAVTHRYESNPYSAQTAGSGKVVNVPAGQNNIFSMFGFKSEFKYHIQAASGGNLIVLQTGISEVRTFILNSNDPSIAPIVNNCYKYPKVRLMFLNSLGGMEYFNFRMISKRFIDATRDKYQKPLPFNYGVGARGRAVVNTNASESVTIGTDFLTTDFSEWLCTEFYTSPEVYELKEDGTIRPIILDGGSLEIKNNFNDKTVQLGFRYTYSFDVATTSGGIGGGVSPGV